MRPARILIHRTPRNHNQINLYIIIHKLHRRPHHRKPIDSSQPQLKVFIRLRNVITYRKNTHQIMIGIRNYFPLRKSNIRIISSSGIIVIIVSGSSEAGSPILSR